MARHLHFIPAAGLQLKEKAVSKQALTLELLLSDSDDLLASGRVWAGGRASCPCTQASPSVLPPSSALGGAGAPALTPPQLILDVDCAAEDASPAALRASTVHGVSLQAPSYQVCAAVTLGIPGSSPVDVAAFPAAGQLPGCLFHSALTSSPLKSCPLPSWIRPFTASAGHKKMFFSADVVFLCT